MRGEWIEIDNDGATKSAEKSRPVRGEWIEIICNSNSDFPRVVSPREGRVD